MFCNTKDYLTHQPVRQCCNNTPTVYRGSRGAMKQAFASKLLHTLHLL